MPVVRFTYALKRFFPNLQPFHCKATTVNEALQLLEKEYPGISGYLVDESGSVRKHVLFFIGTEQIRDRNALSDELLENDELFIMQALSGG